MYQQDTQTYQTVSWVFGNPNYNGLGIFSLLSGKKGAPQVKLVIAWILFNRLWKNWAPY